MKRLKLALLVGGIGLIIAFLHLVAINFFLYWDLAWFDLMMHFLGGVWVSLLGFWIMAFLTRTKEFSIKSIIYIAVFFTVGIGILWELFEAGAGISFVGKDMWGDTFSDLALDIVGGLVSGFYISKIFNERR